MKRLIAAALALLAPVAHADPIDALLLLQPILGSTVAAFVVSNAAAIALIGVGFYQSASARRKARRQAAEARAQYNASLTDRTATVLQADPPHRIVVGRAVTGGNVIAMFTSDKSARREDGTAYTKPDGLRHLVIEIAHHQCAAINETYIDGIAVGTLDVNGWATSGEFASARTDSRSVTVPASGYLDVPEPVNSLLQAFWYDAGSTSANVDASPTLSLGNTRITNPEAHDITVNYTINATISRVRISKHLGTDTQTVDTYLNGVKPTEWDSSHRGLGVTYVVLTEDLEETRFQAGPSNYTFDVSGALFEDPRTGVTQWTDNPAVITRSWLRAEYGYGCLASDVDDAYSIAAANACDVPIDLVVDGVTTSGQKTYTCNGSFTTDQSKEAILEQLAECMAGVVVYGAQWMIMAGAWTPPVTLPNGSNTLTDDDLDGQIELVQAGAGMDDIVNSMRGNYVPAGKAVPADLKPPYQNATFVAADGEELWSDMSLPFTDNPARARNLARIKVERARAGQVIRYPAKLTAWPLRVGDRINVRSTEYSLPDKTYRVTDWQFGITSPVTLTLQEDAAEIYDQADAATSDPTPNSNLPDPWTVQTITGAGASSNTEWIQGADGTILPRVRVHWNALTDSYVLNGNGRIELLWRRNESLVWTQLNLPGDATQAFIDGLRSDDRVVVELRAVNGFNKTGDSTFVAHTVAPIVGVPPNASGFTVTQIPTGLLFTWTPATFPGYGLSEVHEEAVWNDATAPVWKAKGNFFEISWPSAGSHTYLLKHRDQLGQGSTVATSVTVTVDAGGLVDTAQMKTDSATVVAVSKVTSTTASNASSSDVTVTANSLSYTNTTSATIAIQVELSCFQVYMYAWSFMTVHEIWIDQTGAVGGSTHETFAQMLTGADLTEGPSKVFQYSLAAGATISLAVKIRSASSNGASGITMDASILRVAAIKR